MSVGARYVIDLISKNEIHFLRSSPVYGRTKVDDTIGHFEIRPERLYYGWEIGSNRDLSRVKSKEWWFFGFHRWLPLHSLCGFGRAFFDYTVGHWIEDEVSVKPLRAEASVGSRSGVVPFFTTKKGGKLQKFLIDECMKPSKKPKTHFGSWIPPIELQRWILLLVRQLEHTPERNDVNGKWPTCWRRSPKWGYCKKRNPTKFQKNCCAGTNGKRN